MLIKIRLLRQAWLLSHSYYYCLDLWYYKRKEKACSRRVMVVNFSREGFSLQFFSINDCCMNGLQGLLEDSVDPLGNPCCNMYAGFFPLCSSDLKNYLLFLGCFFHWNIIAGNLFLVSICRAHIVWNLRENGEYAACPVVKANPPQGFSCLSEIQIRFKILNCKPPSS